MFIYRREIRSVCGLVELGINQLIVAIDFILPNHYSTLLYLKLKKTTLEKTEDSLSYPEIYESHKRKGRRETFNSNKITPNFPFVIRQPEKPYICLLFLLNNKSL